MPPCALPTPSPGCCHRREPFSADVNVPAAHPPKHDLRAVAHTLLATDDSRPVHFIGIAGAGMSALAELFRRRGVPVQGTDAHPESAQWLAQCGITVHAHDAALIAHARAVVYSSAIPAAHPEMQAARERGLPVVRRAEALGAAVSGGTVVGVAGTHGKTTTTVMVTEALAAAGLDPTGIVGGHVPAWHGHLRAGSDDLYVVEADEYDRSFLALDPTVAVILNLEADHLDIYRDLADIRDAFTAFLAPSRAVVLCADDEHAAALDVGVTREVVRYGVRTERATMVHETPFGARLVADYVRQSVGADGTPRTEADLTYDGTHVGTLRLRVPGVHNVRNALAALGAGVMVGASIERMLPGLDAFAGVDRRFQHIAAVQGIDIIDDYAHHPTEVAATIAAARARYDARRLVVAFQPHLFSRTRDFAREFAAALSGADVVALCTIYPAREAPIPGVTHALIGDHMQRLGHAPRWSGPREGCAEALLAVVRPGDVVITMGAGDITRVGPALATLLRATHPIMGAPSFK